MNSDDSSRSAMLSTTWKKWQQTSLGHNPKSMYDIHNWLLFDIFTNQKKETEQKVTLATSIHSLNFINKHLPEYYQSDSFMAGYFPQVILFSTAH